MEQITKRLVVNNIGSFIAVLLLFGVGWKYLDEQRVEAFKIREEAIKLKAEADVREVSLRKIEKELADQKIRLESEANIRKYQLDTLSSHLSNKEKSLSVDAELRQLSSRYLDESSVVNASKTCGDDETHNERARKARATLSLIESLAKQYNKPEFLSFIKKQQTGIQSWELNCKP